MLAIIVRNKEQREVVLKMVRELVANPDDMPGNSAHPWNPDSPIFMYVQDDRWEGWDGNQMVQDGTPYFKDAEIIDLGE